MIEVAPGCESEAERLCGKTLKGALRTEGDRGASGYASLLLIGLAMVALATKYCDSSYGSETERGRAAIGNLRQPCGALSWL